MSGTPWTLTQVAHELWIVDGDCVDFHGFPYPTRSVIVRLEGGALWIWSPIAFTVELGRAVDALGTPRYLIGPNKIHHLFLAPWSRVYPGAELWAPTSLIEKRSEIAFTGALESARGVWTEEFELLHVTGSFAMDEVLFFHRASRTLIVADFIEHFGDAFLARRWKPWQRWLAHRWGITEGRGHAPLDWRATFIRRRPLRALRKRILALEPTRVIMAHGELVETDVDRFLAHALRWI